MNAAFQPANPDFAARVRDSFGRQPFMEHIGARITAIEPGFCEITVDYQKALTQQHGFVHGGVLASIADSAAGYAAFSLMPAEASILTVEYKLNILRPGQGEAMIARGRVLKPGRCGRDFHRAAPAAPGALSALPMRHISVCSEVTTCSSPPARRAKTSDCTTLGLIAWGGYWAALRIREGGAARAALSAFLAKVSEGRLDDAYQNAAPELRCRLSLEQFRGLAGYYANLRPGLHADVSVRQGWPHFPVADIDVSTHYDQDIPHHAALVKLDEGWRVAWIDRKQAAEVRASDRKCGERSMHIAMIRQPLRDLLDGFERGDDTKLAERFHRSRSQAGPGLAEFYAHLKSKAAALKEALGAEPVFDADPAQKEGAWTLAASLRAQGVRFSVRANFMLDGGWKLMLFEVDAAPAPN